ncbi:MAG TPA: hypothetical protein VF364_03910 [Candidatus Limnocylindria bacterium]
MQSAAVLSAAVIASGIYLAIASMIGFSTSWIALGILAIAVLASVAMMAANGPSRARVS